MHASFMHASFMYALFMYASFMQMLHLCKMLFLLCVMWLLAYSLCYNRYRYSLLGPQLLAMEEVTVRGEQMAEFAAASAISVRELKSAASLLRGTWPAWLAASGRERG